MGNIFTLQNMVEQLLLWKIKTSIVTMPFIFPFHGDLSQHSIVPKPSTLDFFPDVDLRFLGPKGLGVGCNAATMVACECIITCRLQGPGKNNVRSGISEQKCSSWSDVPQPSEWLRARSLCYAPDRCGQPGIRVWPFLWLAVWVCNYSWLQASSS